MKNIKDKILVFILFLSFISLGIPDSCFGVGWTSIRLDLKLPVEQAGIVSILTTIGTTISSFLSGKILKKFTTGKVAVVSCIFTGIGLIGYSICSNLIEILLFTIPLGLGAGTIDTGLNNYVSKNYPSKILYWLHCFYGVGSFLGANIMSYIIFVTNKWQIGFKLIGFLQIIIGIIIFFSLPIWKKEENKEKEENLDNSLKIEKNILKEKGVKETMLAFPLFMFFEMSFGLWMTSYIIEHKNIEQKIAGVLISTFFISIMLGRFLKGFIRNKYNNIKIIRESILKVFLGIILIIILPNKFIIISIILIGFGIGPIYPCMIYETPKRFPNIDSEIVTGYQIGAGYLGILILMPLISFLVKLFSLAIVPFFLLIVILITFFLTERLAIIIKK